ncbi:hypothetical protein OV079_07735 [Nannocystis pusilla]|uniref:Uncharacterized protein n=1 Tax=Nannocystis pusilla TaxID=889268 RepID=A0A9X3EU03_9BACT|nr:hypothetical protein [Nannocystis pusilla]MCY1005463.1 hypothetical protein [Nannocystis pusilla]
MALVPETHLFPCARCSELLRVADPVCPHCGAMRSRAERTGPLVALAAALAVAACGTPQPEYGVPDTDTNAETLGTDATTTDATTTDATTDATTTDATTTDATDTTAPTTGTGTTDETSG